MKLTYVPSDQAPQIRDEAEFLEGFLNRPGPLRLIEREAAGQEVPVQELVHRSVEEALSRRERNGRARTLMRQWIQDGDEEEQRDTLDALKQGLNSHHSSGRQIFP